MCDQSGILRVIFWTLLFPGILTLFWIFGLLTIGALKICLVISLLIFVIFPIIFAFSVHLQRGILFLTFITYPPGLDLSNPVSIGLFGTRSFHLNVQDNDIEDDSKILRIGVWHVLPLSMALRFKKELKIKTEFGDSENFTSDNNKALDEQEHIIKSEFPEITKNNEQIFYERMLRIPGTVVIYLHGNTASRGSGHRSEVYKLLRKLNYHVLALDYRSYGDSDPASVTEEGVVKDALEVFFYIRNITSNPVIIWGHSLGTGVATNMLAQISHLKENGARGVILESPFTNIRDEIRLHPFAKLFRNLPWFDLTILQPMYKNSLRFESDQHVSEFPQPIMIIHAEDDCIVPIELGYKLYRTAIDTRNKAWGPVEFHRFKKEKKYGHKYLCRAPELPGLVKTFIQNYKDVVFYND